MGRVGDSVVATTSLMSQPIYVHVSISSDFAGCNMLMRKVKARLDAKRLDWQFTSAILWISVSRSFFLSQHLEQHYDIRRGVE